MEQWSTVFISLLWRNPLAMVVSKLFAAAGAKPGDNPDLPLGAIRTNPLAPARGTIDLH